MIKELHKTLITPDMPPSVRGCECQQSGFDVFRKLLLISSVMDDWGCQVMVVVWWRNRTKCVWWVALQTRSAVRMELWGNTNTSAASINQSVFLCVLYCKTKSERKAYKLTPAAILPQDTYFRCCFDLYRNVGSAEYTVLLSTTLSLIRWPFWETPVPEHKKHLHSRWR